MREKARERSKLEGGSKGVYSLLHSQHCIYMCIELPNHKFMKSLIVQSITIYGNGLYHGIIIAKKKGNCSN